LRSRPDGRSSPTACCAPQSWPRRATAPELEALAERLETEFGAPRTAAFVREALEVYRVRAQI
jgi:propanediol dehydratase small subunit